jgi:hypothetical protein
MYAFVKQMCQACPGCALANPPPSKLSELIYNFLIKAPFLVMHFDAYLIGASVACQVLHAWNLLQMRLQPPLHPPS